MHHIRENCLRFNNCLNYLQIVLMNSLLRSAGLLFIAILAFTTAQSSPIDTSRKRLSTFDKISQDLQAYKPDTSTPPADRMTQTIRQIMKLRGGFNINEALEYKIEEDRHRGET